MEKEKVLFAISYEENSEKIENLEELFSTFGKVLYKGSPRKKYGIEQSSKRMNNTTGDALIFETENYGDDISKFTDKLKTCSESIYKVTCLNKNTSIFSSLNQNTPI